MRLLFVDDDEFILRATKRLFTHDASRWEVFTSSSPGAALAQLESIQPDIVISDLRMPEMNGLAFLAEVERREPASVRIILTAASSGETGVDILQVAHQVFYKPFELEQFEGALTRAYQVPGTRANRAIRRAVGEKTKLPVLPDLYQRLESLLRLPEASARDAAELLAQDPAMLARVLQLANSAWYSRGSPVLDALGAVVRLGIRVIQSLVLHASFFAKQAPSEESLEWLSRLQRLGLSAGHIAGLIWRGTPAHGDAISACLLADVGQLLLHSLYGADYLELGQEVSKECSLAELESAHYGFTHAEAGAHLLSVWGLPPNLVEAVLVHDNASPPGLAWTLGSSIYFAHSLAEDRTLGPQWRAHPLAAGLLRRFARDR
jgi:HD-like signal output (HDOD) protein